MATKNWCIYIYIYTNPPCVIIYNKYIVYNIMNRIPCRVFPHIFVWGSCFWFCTPASGPPPPPPPASSSYNLPTHNLSTHLSTHNLLTHTQLVHTQLVLTQLVHTCPHTTSSRNLSTHNLSTFTTCPDTTCPCSLCVAGVALGDSHLQFAWEAWHLWHGRRGTWRHGPPLCVAFLRGRRGAWRHPPSLCMVSVALGDIHLCVAGVASTVNLRGRRGTYGTGLVPR